MATTTTPSSRILTQSGQNLFSTAPAHRVLFTPELLHLILSDIPLGGWKMQLYPRDYSACARVSRHWTPIALDFLYRGSDHCRFLGGLFQKLVPLTGSSDDDYLAFTRSPEASDWARFEPYRLRLREFHESRAIDRSIYTDIVQTRPSGQLGPLFPNLRELAWYHCDIEEAFVFMHPGLREVYFCMNERMLQGLEQKPNLVNTLFSRLTVAAINLVSLGVVHESCEDFDKVPAELPGLIKQLVKLEEVILSPTFLTDEVMHALGQLRSLRTLNGAERQDLDRVDHGWQAIMPLQPLKEPLKSSSFPSLLNLEIFQPFEAAVSVIDTPFFPPRLQTLKITSHVSEDHDRIQRMLSILQLHAPSTLLELDLVFQQDRIWPVWIPESRLCRGGSTAGASHGDQAPDPARIITFKTLEPLSTLSSLTSLSMIYDHYLDISREELYNVLTGLPRLVALVLGCSATQARRARITLEYLVTIGKCCPRLRHLGMFCDATVCFPIPEDVDNDEGEGGDYDDDEYSSEEEYSRGGTQRPVLKRLRVFNPRLSVITADASTINRVVAYLQRVLPADCSLGRSGDWPDPEWELIEELDEFDGWGDYRRLEDSLDEQEGDAEAMVAVFKEREMAWLKVKALFENGGVMEEEESGSEVEGDVEDVEDGPGDSELEADDQESVILGTDSERE